MTTHHRLNEELLATSHPTVYWKIRRKLVLSCAYCSPHRNENQGRRPKRDRYKDRRKGGRARIRIQNLCSGEAV